MSRINFVGQTPLDTNVSMAADYTSPSVDVRNLINASFNVIAGSGATGDWKVQWSNDGVTFYQLLDPSGSDVELGLAGNADTLQFDLTNFSYGFLRIIYDFTSGSGTADIIYQGKSLG